MKLAVFSDIHGNYIAFEKCINYALKQGITSFIFLGDYLGEFPYPQKTMELIYTLKEKYVCYFVRGNKEDYWIKRHYNNHCEWKDGNITVGALKYSYAHLTEKDIAFYETLPIIQEVKIEDAEPILICHGSPNRNNEKMLPDQENTKHIMEECSYKYILCGHTHIQYAINYENKIVLNPGAVGVPLHSGGKAQFMILYKDYHDWQYKFVELDYDKERVIEELRESGLEREAPYWSQVTKNLVLTGELAHGEVLSRAMQLCEETGENCNWYDVPEVYWKKAIEEMIG